MKPSTKVLMMNHVKEREREREDWPDDRYRDRRGREHYDDGRYAPRAEGDYWIEGRNDDKTRERERERYYPRPEMNYSGEDYSSRPRPQIGFVDSSVNYPSRREMMPYSVDEMSYRSSRADMGHAESSGYMPFTKDMADMWMKGMANEDGSKGPHWTLEQTKQLQAQKHIDCDPIEFWAAMNMIYSDYFKAAKKFGVGNNIDFYVDMAKAFLDDKDAREDKIGRYFAYIVQH